MSIENNILISKFLGGNDSIREVWKIKGISTYGWSGDIAKHFRNNIMKMKVGEAILADQLMFNLSYEWIMYVVDHIESLTNYSVIITKNSTSVMEKGCLIVSNINDTKLDSIYNAVIEFINWWNNVTYR